jgi:hypothetical protein
MLLDCFSVSIKSELTHWRGLNKFGLLNQGVYQAENA